MELRGDREQFLSQLSVFPSISLFQQQRPFKGIYWLLGHFDWPEKVGPDIFLGYRNTD